MTLCFWKSARTVVDSISLAGMVNFVSLTSTILFAWIEGMYYMKKKKKGAVWDDDGGL